MRREQEQAKRIEDGLSALVSEKHNQLQELRDYPYYLHLHIKLKAIPENKAMWRVDNFTELGSLLNIAVNSKEGKYAAKLHDTTIINLKDDEVAVTWNCAWPEKVRDILVHHLNTNGIYDGFKIVYQREVCDNYKYDKYDE